MKAAKNTVKTAKQGKLIKSEKSANATKAKDTVKAFVEEAKPEVAAPASTTLVAWSGLTEAMRASGLKRSRQPWVFNMIVENERVTLAEIMKGLSINEKRAGRILRALESNGLVERDPKGAKLDVATFVLAEGITAENAHDTYETKVKENDRRGLKAKAKDKAVVAAAK